MSEMRGESSNEKNIFLCELAGAVLENCTMHVCVYFRQVVHLICLPLHTGTCLLWFEIGDILLILRLRLHNMKTIFFLSNKMSN